MRNKIIIDRVRELSTYTDVNSSAMAIWPCQRSGEKDCRRAKNGCVCSLHVSHWDRLLHMYNISQTNSSHLVKLLSLLFLSSIARHNMLFMWFSFFFCFLSDSYFAMRNLFMFSMWIRILFTSNHIFYSIFSFFSYKVTPCSSSTSTNPGHTSSVLLIGSSAFSLPLSLSSSLCLTEYIFLTIYLKCEISLAQIKDARRTILCMFWYCPIQSERIILY